MANLPSEFEVQAEAYCNLKKVYPGTRGEYKVPKDPTRKLYGARLDIAIFDSGKNMKLIIEIKKNPIGDNTKQATRYTRLTGTPCIYIRGMDEAENAVEIVNTYLAKHNITIQ